MSRVHEEQNCNGDGLQASGFGLDARRRTIARSLKPVVRSPTEIRIRELLELTRRRVATSRIPIAGEIDEVKRRSGSALHAEKVRQPCLARGCARPGQLAAEQRVNQARLAHVRAADDRQLRQSLPRETTRVRRAGHEFGADVHGQPAFTGLRHTEALGPLSKTK